MDYGDVFKLNFNLFDQNSNGLECFREWLIIVGSATSIPFIILAIMKIRKFTRVCTLDQIILGMEAFKVSETTCKMFRFLCSQL